MGDLNHDTYLDLIVTDYSSNMVSILLGNGDGTFQPSVGYGTGVHPVSVAIGDFNEDTKPDLVVANYDSANVSILLGNGDGTFGPSTTFSSNIGPYGVTVGDFNEDGHLDVATSNVNFGTINVMLGNGNGALQGPTPYTAGTRPQVIAAADLNGDHHIDLVVPNYAGSSVSVFLGNGNGTFQSAVSYTVEAGPDFLAVAELNGDNHPDLITSHYSTGNLSVLLGNGDGTFQPPVTHPTGGANPIFVSVGDFNGDGIPDLATPNYGSNTVGILMGSGTGNFSAPTTFATGTGTSPVSVLPGDFNRDGRLDMFTGNENTNNASVFLNTCLPGTSPTATRTALPSATGVPPSFTPGATGTSLPTGTPTAVATATATSTVCTINFSDVSTTDYFYEAVRYLYCHGAISGYADGTFRPYNNTTRGQLSKIVVLAEGWPLATPTGTPTFSDVPANSAFYAYVETAYAHNIISGYACGTACLEFRPNNNVTRVQLTKIIVLAQNWAITPPQQPTFRDVPLGGTFYGYVETAYAHNIISGYACGTACLEFRPNNNATRGQISKIVYNAVTQP